MSPRGRRITSPGRAQRLGRELGVGRHLGLPKREQVAPCAPGFQGRRPARRSYERVFETRRRPVHLQPRGSGHRLRTAVGAEAACDRLPRGRRHLQLSQVVARCVGSTGPLARHVGAGDREPCGEAPGAAASPRAVDHRRPQRSLSAGRRPTSLLDVPGFGDTLHGQSPETVSASASAACSWARPCGSTRRARSPRRQGSLQTKVPADRSTFHQRPAGAVPSRLWTVWVVLGASRAIPHGISPGRAPAHFSGVRPNRASTFGSP